MSLLYRCSKEKCKQRRALPKKLERYVRPPKCHSCGGTKFRLDMWQMKAGRRLKCLCDGLHFPHKTGSKWCVDYKGEYTEEDYQERHGGRH